ncbi:WCX domain-containing protein [Prevotella sp.]|nr:WYL domain-containing protein [Prevotella sp.]
MHFCFLSQLAYNSEILSKFEYHLKPEFDFEQEIFSNMDAMEVLEPLWLRDEVAERLRNLMKKYKI